MVYIFFQCLKQSPVDDSVKCLIEPMECKEGLSFSIWEKPLLETESVLNQIESNALNQDNFKYIISTGKNKKKTKLCRGFLCLCKLKYLSKGKTNSFCSHTTFF